MYFIMHSTVTRHYKVSTYLLTSPTPSPCPKSKPQIRKRQIQKGKGEFCLQPARLSLKIYGSDTSPEKPRVSERSPKSSRWTAR